MIKKIKNHILLYFYKIKWRIFNKHNNTRINSFFDIRNVSVGNYTYGKLNVFNDTSNKLVIGNYCSIANEVMFLVGGEHSSECISTFPFKTYILQSNDFEAVSKGNIVIDDDVWIGYGSIILSNVHIGQGAIIGAGSVVTKDVPPYAIVAGNPAKIIKYRFSEEVVKELIKIDYLKLDKEKIINNIDKFYCKVIDKEHLRFLDKKTVN